MKAETANSKNISVIGNSYLSPNREILTAMLKRWRQKLGYFTIFTALPAILASQAQAAQADETVKTEGSNEGQTTALPEKLNKNRNTPEFLKRRTSFLLLDQKSKFNVLSPLSGSDNCPGNPIPAGAYTAAAPYTDTGNTTGANNTVNYLQNYYYYYNSYNPAGADQIYSFTLTGRGANPKIEVTATSATYQPMIYLLAGGCPAGVNNALYNWYQPKFASQPGGTATYDTSNYLPLNVPLYLFIDSQSSDANSSGPYTLKMQDVTIAPLVLPKPKFDFDGDGKADISVFRPSVGFWYLNRSAASGFTSNQFGLSTDKLAPADYDGDGKTDIAVYRNGMWYLNRSQAGFLEIAFGDVNDVPQPADFDGDGKAELVLWHPAYGTFNIYDLSTNQFYVYQFGTSEDKPVVGDYDGDGKADYAVFRPSNGGWSIQGSASGFLLLQFGLGTDKPVPADYDGDGLTDIAVYRPSSGIWYIHKRQTDAISAFQFGISTDIPAPADYDGDGKADLAVFRDGMWYLRQSTNGFTSIQFGAATDKPVPNAFVP